MLQVVTQRRIKQIKALHSQKGRKKHQLFLGETHKIFDFIYSVKPDIIHAVYGLEDWYRENENKYPWDKIPFYSLDEKQLKALSLLKNPRDVIFTLYPFNDTLSYPSAGVSPLVIFDTIQDPGNFGTIIRTMAWFGIRHIICSPDSVDVYNPKVIQATMGAFCLVNVYYLNIEEFMLKHPSIEYYYTDMKGEDIYSFDIDPAKSYAIIFGNEGRGVSSSIKKIAGKSLSIPPFAKDRPESLNLSISAGIVVSELMRKIFP